MVCVSVTELIGAGVGAESDTEVTVNVRPSAGGAGAGDASSVEVIVTCAIAGPSRQASTSAVSGRIARADAETQSNSANIRTAPLFSGRLAAQASQPWVIVWTDS